jgi:uncharacterized protein YodC (DUF2158 family)
MSEQSLPFKPADVVRFKIGGPRMVVNQVADDEVECVWFEGNGDFFHAWYAAELLEHDHLVPHQPDADGVMRFAFSVDCLEIARGRVADPSSN